MRYISLILVVYFMVGCSFKNPTEKKYGWINNEKNQQFNKSKSTSLKYPVILIGDNQFNNIYTNPTIWRNYYADKLTKVSIRPPQLDIFSPELFNWTLNEHNIKNRYFVHLGDGLNIACLNEWGRFQKSLLDNVDNHRFVMAPGNHDFFWYGVTAGQGRTIKRDWAIACDNSYPIENADANESKRFTKGKFINHYLAYIPINYPKDTTGEYRDNRKNAFVERIFVQRFPTENDEYSSFLLQSINIPTKSSKKLKGLVIDTANYEGRPLNFLGYFSIGGHKNPGEMAEIGKKQKSMIESWSREYSKRKEEFIIFGHHPLKEFDEKQRAWLMSLIDKNPYALGYISAHTHLGYVEDRAITEVNVGSITDYPNEIRTLENSKSKVSSILYPIEVEQLKQCQWYNDRYDYTNATYDNYTSYKDVNIGIYTAHYTHEATLDVGITTYLRLFNDLSVKSYFKSNEKKSQQYEELIAKATKERSRDCFASFGTTSKYSTILYDNKSSNFIKSTQCRSDKLEILKKLQKLNDSLKETTPRYAKELQLYGSCQSLRASSAEWLGNLEKNLNE